MMAVALAITQSKYRIIRFIKLSNFNLNILFGNNSSVYWIFSLSYSYQFAKKQTTPGYVGEKVDMVADGAKVVEDIDAKPVGPEMSS